MTNQDALEKVQKLLRLSKSDNANEAAVAMGMAQRIIDKHKLDMASLELNPEQEEPIQDFRDDLLDDSAASWKGRLAVVVCKANGCKPYLLNSKGKKGKKGIGIIGRKSDVDAVRYMYSWLSNETDSLMKAANDAYGRTWCNNFRMGVIDTLAERLKKEKQDFEAQAVANNQGSALVRVSDNARAVEVWTRQNLHLRARSAGQMRGNASAREAGREAGRSINLGGGSGQIGAGRKCF